MPFSVISIEGPGKSAHNELRSVEQVAMRISDAYARIAEEEGRVVGSHVLSVSEAQSTWPETDIGGPPPLADFASFAGASVLFLVYETE